MTRSSFSFAPISIQLIDPEGNEVDDFLVVVGVVFAFVTLKTSPPLPTNKVVVAVV